MLNLKSIIAAANKPVAPKTKKSTPDFTLTIGEKSEVTLSEAFMLKADVQNNVLCVYYEKSDNKTYFIFHKGDVISIDFFKGRKLPLKDEAGNDVLDESGKKVMSDEIGKKSNKFKDTITESELTVAEMICKQYPETKVLNLIKGNLKEVDVATVPDAKEFGATSIWTFELLLEVNVEELTTFSNTVVVDSDTLVSSTTTSTTITTEELFN